MPPIELNSEPDDLRATIEAQFDAPETPVIETPTPDAPEPEAAAPEVPEVTEPLADHPTDPTRYANGKFKPTKSEPAPTQVEPGQEIPSTDTTKASTEPAPTPASAPPAGWTAAEKAEWSKLPPAIQAAVSRREAEMSRGGQQWSEEKRRYETTLAPVAQAAARRGMRTEEGLQSLMRAQDFLDRDPRGAIQWLAKSYGVDIATLAGQAAEVPAQSQPDIASLVRQAVMPYVAPIQERWQTEEQQRKQSSISLIDQFAAEPGHEHYAALESEILAVLPLVQQSKPGATQKEWLQEAYDRAVYVNPQTRASVLAAREAEAEAKRVADAKARADKARKAGASVTGSPSGTAAAGPKDSLRAEIEAAFAGS